MRLGTHTISTVGIRRAGCAGVAGVALMGFVSLAAAPQEHPPTPHRHPEAQGLVNPGPKDADALARGAAVYAKHCANCHGPNGLGNGRLAAGMAAYGARPSDLTDAEWQHGSSDGEIFSVIRDGLGTESQMPRYAGRLEDAEIWDLVHHIRSLSP